MKCIDTLLYALSLQEIKDGIDSGVFGNHEAALDDIISNLQSNFESVDQFAPDIMRCNYTALTNEQRKASLARKRTNNSNNNNNNLSCIPVKIHPPKKDEQFMHQQNKKITNLKKKLKKKKKNIYIDAEAKKAQINDIQKEINARTEDNKEREKDKTYHCSVNTSNLPSRKRKQRDIKASEKLPPTLQRATKRQKISICVCNVANREEDDDTWVWIACDNDNCREWFHTDCVNLIGFSQENVEAIGEWLCPTCLQSKRNSNAK